MKFNALIPELSVRDLEKSKAFYIGILQFTLEYERTEDRFAFISLEGNQLMLEEINGHWETGELVYPFGRGVNFEMTVSDVEGLYQRVLEAGIPLFRDWKTSRYRMDDEEIVQTEFLVQDPDGYLLRFTD